MSREEFDNKLMNLVASGCSDSRRAGETLDSLIDSTTSLIVYLYIKTNLKSYDDFVTKAGNILKESKEILLEKYQIAMENEI